MRAKFLIILGIDLPKRIVPLIVTPIQLVALGNVVFAVRATHEVAANEDSDDHHRGNEDQNGHKTNDCEHKNRLTPV